MCTLFGDVLDISSRYEIQQLRQAFVAMVSHELRTPLTSISGFLSMLNMGVYGEVGDKVKSEATRADQSVNRLMTLINDLLDLEKLESGSVDRSGALFTGDDIRAIAQLGRRLRARSLCEYFNA